jgi:uncharacterized protein
LAPTEAFIAVRLTARAGKNALESLGDGILKARVSAPPVNGEANKALCRLIAKQAGVAPSRVSVVRGQKSRDKLVRVDGVDGTTLEEKLKS